MTTTELLQNARNLIANVGWCKKAYCQFDKTTGKPNAYCSSGALYAATDAFQDLFQQEESFSEQTSNTLLNDICPLPIKTELDQARALLSAAIPPGTTILVWNDDPFTTKEMVLAAFDKAIEASKQ